MNRDERRSEQRARFKGEGFFIKDATLWELKFLDSSTSGLGAVCNREFRPGEQGIINGELPYSSGLKSILGEVCWCMRDPDPDDPFYPYRLGLRFLN